MMKLGGFYRKMLTQSILLLLTILAISTMVSYLVSYQILMQGTQEYMDEYASGAMDDISDRFMHIKSFLELINQTVVFTEDNDVTISTNMIQALLANFDYLQGAIIVRDEKAVYFRRSDGEHILMTWLKDGQAASVEESFFISWRGNRNDSGYVISSLILDGELRPVVLTALGRDGKDGFNAFLINDKFFNNVVYYQPEDIFFYDDIHAYQLGEFLEKQEKSLSDQLAERDFLSEPISVFDERIYLLKSLRESEFSLVYSSDFSVIQKSLNTLLKDVILFGISWIVVLIVISVFFFNWLTRPLRNLQRNIREQLATGFSSTSEMEPAAGFRRLWGRSISIRLAGFLYLTVSALIPVLVMVSYLVFNVRVLEQNELGARVRHAVNRTANELDNRLNNYENAAGYLADQELLIAGISDVNRNGSVLDFRESLRQVVIPQLSFEKDILNISIIGLNDKVIYNVSQAESMLSEEGPEITPLEDPEDVSITVGEDVFKNQYLRFTTGVVDAAGQRQGTILLDANLSEFQNLLSGLEAEFGSRSMIFCGGEEITRSFSQSQSAFANSLDGFINSDAEMINIGSKTYLLFNNDLGFGNCRILATADTELLDYLVVSPLINRNIILAVVYLLVISVMAERFSYSVTRSINRLQHAMGYAEEGYFLTYHVPSSRDEIEQLGRDFNLMIKQIRQLIHDNRLAVIHEQEATINAIEAQYNAMQAQINPHFLHNVLETIHYMIVLEDSRSIKMVQLLGNLFRIGIGKGERFVKIEQEVKHALLFTEIENIRFMDRFKVNIEIDDDVMQLYTVRFILQPIVENSVRYGLELTEEGGIILIKGWLEDGEVFLQVSDNGEGMTPERVDTVVKVLRGELDSKSIGLQNVHQRVRLNFGEKYGIRIQSVLNEGTTVTVKLPRLETAEQNKTRSVV